MRRDVFQAIADPTRRAIIALIALQAMTPNSIAEHFDTTRQAVSVSYTHLDVYKRQLRHNRMLFAGQWDGIYKKNDISPKWELSSSGLPPNFAATNLQVFNNILVISTSESSNNSSK